MNDKIIIKGAKEHNLKNINLEIPRDKMVVITGLSGSGKSSLAFDTLYAEGQRRYVESLSSYARQFLGLMEKPDVERIDGLSPAISIDQKTTSKNPRSTVGTVTEIYDYIRLLYARIGVPYCPNCHKKIEKQTIDQIVDNIMSLEEGTKIQVLAPVVRGRKGEYTKQLEGYQKEGFVRVRIDGENYELSDDIEIDRKKKHEIELVVDRLVIRDDITSRLTESVEVALKHADNLVLIDIVGKNPILYSCNYACPDCGFSFPELTPRMFSFNNPFGACPECTGIGYLMKMDEDLIEKLDNEMNDADAFYYEKTHLYLTKNYIINFQGRFKVIEYRDVIWMYAMNYRTNGIKTSQSINIMDVKGKVTSIATINIVTKEKKEIYDEIWNTIASKNKNILLGYTKENAETGMHPVRMILSRPFVPQPQRKTKHIFGQKGNSKLLPCVLQ